MSAQFEIQFFENILRNYPKYVDALELLGTLYTQNGEIDKGLKVDQKLVRLEPNNPTARYNLACSLALKKRRKDAIKELTKSIELGYQDWAWMLKDPDLKSLHLDPDFQALFPNT